MNEQVYQYAGDRFGAITLQLVIDNKIIIYPNVYMFSFLILTTGYIEDIEELQNQLFNHMKSGKILK